MNKNRLEAFSDGVIAIIITIMVLELKVPHGTSFADIFPLAPVFFSYVLSFIYVGIYWNNHHHLFQAAKQVTGATLWANLHLLFWLSLTPFVTAWAGENHFESLPVALYGVVLLMCGVGFTILTRVLVKHHGHESTLAVAVGRDRKGKLSVVVYIISICLAFRWPMISCALYVAVALMWLVPDTRIETAVQPKPAP